jgi:hypothetical protein
VRGGERGTKGGNNTSPECLHQSIIGQRQMGEYFAKVYAKVVVSGATTVTVTLASTPVGTDQRLLYAYAQNQPAFGVGCTGPGIQSNGALYSIGAHGNLCDSDATVSRYGFPLYNWGETRTEA